MAREGEDQAPLARVALLLQAVEEALVEPLAKAVELRGEMVDGLLRARGVVQRECRPPYLGPLILAQVGEELHEAGDQVGLGEEDIDREADAEVLMQLLDALAHGARLDRALGLGLLHQVGERDSHQCPVDGPPRPVPLEHPEEALPSGAVHRLEAVLRGIAARGIEQHRLFGEPPIAVAGTADAADGVLPETFRQGKIEPRVQQGRRLAAAGRADDHVPGKLVEILSA